MSREDVLKQFEREVRLHKLHIFKDEPGFRHLRFKTAGTSCYYFDLITWPGYLCMTGDMGTWTFCRTEDMFAFFRSKEGDINPCYWSEKLEAGTGCPRDAIAREWDEEAFRKVLDERYQSWFQDNEPDDGASLAEANAFAEKLSTVQTTIDAMKQASSYEFEACAAYGNTHDPEDILCDIWDHHFKKWSTHFIWACYAIVWGIQKYDIQKLAHSAAETFLASSQNINTGNS